MILLTLKAFFTGLCFSQREVQVFTANAVNWLPRLSTQWPLPYHLMCSLTPLQPQWPPCCSWKCPAGFLPPGTYRDSFLGAPQVLTEMSPPQ